VTCWKRNATTQIAMKMNVHFGDSRRISQIIDDRGL